MRLTIEIEPNERSACVLIPRDEIGSVFLSVAAPEQRNGTDRFLRRHRTLEDPPQSNVGPSSPHRTFDDPPKMPIEEHLNEFRRKGVLPAPTGSTSDGFLLEPYVLAVPISDLVANLLRPCFHRDGLGPRRVFAFEDEPLALRKYWSVCYFEFGRGEAKLEAVELSFDADADTVRDSTGRDLADFGLVWAAAVVPLVVEGAPLDPVEMARRDYDLRHFVVDDLEGMKFAYEGWFDRWDERVAELIERHDSGGQPFAEYYHSSIGFTPGGDVLIRQATSALPELAAKCAREGDSFTGLLDSGGSCAIYDGWLAGFLSHSWYYREPRGSILAFQMRTPQRIPTHGASWVFDRRGDQVR